MISDQLPDGCWCEWSVLEWAGGTLKLAAGFDLDLHHSLELHFTDVTFVRCPARFAEPVFREPSESERALAPGSPLLTAFDHTTGAGLIAARKMRVVEGVVYRYWRDDLHDGERMAALVKAPHPRRRMGIWGGHR
jgi:hypothetical protein